MIHGTIVMKVPVKHTIRRSFLSTNFARPVNCILHTHYLSLSLSIRGKIAQLMIINLSFVFEKVHSSAELMVRR